MALKSKYLLAAATFGTAFGAGYVMQNGDALAARFLRGDQVSPQVASTPKAIQLASATLMPATENAVPLPPVLPLPPAAALAPMPRLPDAKSMTDRVSRETSSPVTVPQQQDRSAFGFACDVEVTAESIGAAMVSLSVAAPCALNERVEVAHEGLVFATRTTNTGALDISIPVLAQDARFVVTFRDGTTAEATVSVPELQDYDRVAMVWSGQTDINIHALEFGARYGEGGDVWAGAPRSAEIASHARGGFLTRLGDANLEQPIQAEIYSFPTGTISRDGVVRLNVEAKVTAYSCGRDISARSAQLRRGESVQWLDLTLAVPECDAIGDILVLKNLLQDLKIARN